MSIEEQWWGSGTSPLNPQGPNGGGSGGDPGDPIGESLRFRKGVSDLSKTGMTGGSRIYTVSFWTKHGSVLSGSYGLGIGSNTGATEDFIGLVVSQSTLGENSPTVYGNGSYSGWVTFSEQFRDYSGWYHYHFTYDVGKTGADRVHCYVNGVEVTNRVSNTTVALNKLFQNTKITIGNSWYQTVDCYAAEFYVIDGQALDPTTFGRTNANGVWVPVDPKKDGDTAWYGTNGFHLTFADPGDVGKDYSGNGNDFTATGFDTEPYSPIPYTFTGSVGGGYPNNDEPKYNTIFRLPSSYVYSPSLNSKWEWSPALPFSTLGIYFQGAAADYSGSTFRLTFGDNTTQDVSWSNPSGSTTVPNLVPITTTATSIKSVEYILGGGAYGGGWAGLEIDGSKLLYSPDKPGPTYDLMQDSPTNNFATINPLVAFDSTAARNAADANLTNAGTGAQFPLHSSIAVTHKAYCEFTGPETERNIGLLGFNGTDITDALGYVQYGPYSIGINPDGNVYVNGTSIATVSTYTGTDVLGLAFDPDTREVFFSINGVFENSGNPIYTFPNPLPVGMNWHMSATALSGKRHFNYGQQPFRYTPPAGFEPLSTAEMTAAPIANGRDHFQAITGPGADILTAAQAAFPSGLWWIKDRVNATQHQLVDSVNSDVYAFASSRGRRAYQAPTGDSVAWCWDASDPAKTGFSITTGTHGLGATPDLVINSDGYMWHNMLPTTTTKTFTMWDGYNIGGGTYNNNWAIDSNSVSSDQAGTYYCWRAVPGFSAFGNYTGNANADGPFVYTGFRPAMVWVWYAGTSSGDYHYIKDTTRSPFNPSTAVLAWGNGTQYAEQTIYAPFDILSNGFKLRGTGHPNAALPYAYAAFAENPFQSPVTAR